ncbi:MAG: hypothetical protein WEE89_05715 [Gemmatimonadota bacterium]
MSELGPAWRRSLAGTLLIAIGSLLLVTFTVLGRRNLATSGAFAHHAARNRRMQP